MFPFDDVIMEMTSADIREQINRAMGEQLNKQETLISLYILLLVDKN